MSGNLGGNIGQNFLDMLETLRNSVTMVPFEKCPHYKLQVYFAYFLYDSLVSQCMPLPGVCMPFITSL